jgi:hypothetical protein
MVFEALFSTLKAKKSTGSATSTSATAKKVRPRVTNRAVQRSKQATKKGLVIQALTAKETKQRSRAQGTKENYLGYLRRFAAFLKERDPDAISGEVDENLECFNFPIPEQSINSFLESICYITTEDGYTVLRKAATPTGLLSSCN